MKKLSAYQRMKLSIELIIESVPEPKDELKALRDTNPKLFDTCFGKVWNRVCGHTRKVGVNC